jgi:hypothetical protein
LASVRDVEGNMAITEIPTGTAPTETEGATPFFSERVTLGTRDYVLRFLWNQREAKWYLSIADQSGVAIVSGLKVVADFPINRLVVDDRAPAGTIMAMDLSGEGRDPGLVDLGRRVLLIFVDD